MIYAVGLVVFALIVCAAVAWANGYNAEKQEISDDC